MLAHCLTPSAPSEVLSVSLLLFRRSRGHPLLIVFDLKKYCLEREDLDLVDDLVFLGCAGVRILSRHSRAFPDGPSLSTPGRAVISMARRLTWGMAERILAIFGEGRSYNTTSYTYRPPVVPLAKLFD